MSVPDLEARKRALTDFQSNILVEAAAGTGKTSLMAARVAMMIANGTDPAKIAAITFTELAASELEGRIRWTIDELRARRLPPALRGVIQLPLGATERERLNTAAPRVSEITTTTIHGFCQNILRSHGLDAGLDPGSRVVDETIAEALFDEVLAVWLTEKLSGGEAAGKPVAVLGKDDPLGIVQRIRELANLRRKHRSAAAPTSSFALRIAHRSALRLLLRYWASAWIRRQKWGRRPPRLAPTPAESGDLSWMLAELRRRRDRRILPRHSHQSLSRSRCPFAQGFLGAKRAPRTAPIPCFELCRNPG